MKNVEEYEAIASSAIPDKCRNCGVQCDLATELGSLLILKEIGEHIGEHLVGDDGQEIDRFIESSFPEDMVDVAKVRIRQLVGGGLSIIDDEISEKRDEIEANARACSGTLNMRAAKDSVRYTASICTSSRVYIRGKKKHVGVHVLAENS